jgi:threonyl-tRNA synthetase
MSEEPTEGRRAKASTGPLMDTDKKLIGGESFVERTKNPEWIKKRDEIYATIKARREGELATKTPVNITVTMPDGNVLEKSKEEEPFQAWKTTPYDVAKTISQGLADASTVARVTYANYVDDYSPAEDGMEGEDTLMDAMADLDLDDAKSAKTMLWDMLRPLVGPVSKLELLKFEGDRDAKTVFWHSSAHMLGEALEHLYGCKLTIGPPLAGGFYYDSFMGKDAFREEDCKWPSRCFFCREKVKNKSLLVSQSILSLSQTNPSSKRLTRLSNKSKSLSVWSSPKKKPWNSLRTIPSRSRS